VLEAFGQMQVSRFGPRDALALAGLLILTLALVGSSLPTRELWHPDEARFAVVARTMQERGDLLVPHLRNVPYEGPPPAGVLYEDKPPMLFWLMNLSARALGGFSDVAVRLPALLASVLTVLGVYLVGSFFSDRWSAVLAGMVLATSVLYLMTSQFALTDLVLICFQTWALYCFIRGEYAVRQRRGWYAGFYILVALATLTKGPIGLLVPGAVLAVWVVARRGFRDLRRVGLHWGIPLYLAVVSAWLAPAGLRAGWPYVKHLLLNMSLWRVRGSTYSHQRPWHYYLWTYFLFGWPWALFLPEALVRAVRSWWKTRRDDSLHRASDGLLLALVWFVVVLAGWSVAGAKRPRYVLFAYPAAALAVAWFWSALLSKRERPSWVTTVAAVLCLVTVLAGALATGVAAVPGLGSWVIEHAPGKSSVPAQDRLAALAAWRLPFAALAGSLFAVGMGLAWSLRRRHRGVMFWLAVALVVLQVHAAVWVFPMMNQFRSMRPVAEICRELRSQHPEATIATHDLFWTAIAWYARTTDIAQADAPKEVLALLATDQQAFVIVEASRLEELRSRDAYLGEYWYDERRAGVRRIGILSSRADRALAPTP